MKKRYRSKIGYIPTFIIVIVAIFLPILLFWCDFGYFNILITSLPLIGFIIITRFPVHFCIIENENLIVKWGLLGKVKIDIKTIKKIEVRKRKMEIRYKKYDHIKISPKHKHDFINDLTNINPEIEMVYKS